MEHIWELKHSTLLMPIKEDEFSKIKLDEVFTDIHDFQKQNLDADFRPKAYYFNYYLELLEAALLIGYKSEIGKFHHHRQNT